MFLQSALPLIPVHPDCGNVSILNTVDQFEEEGGGPIRPEVFWAETLGQCIYDNMENPQDPKATEILLKIEVGVDCVVRSTVRGVVVSAEICPGNRLGVVEVDRIVLLK